MQIECPSSNVPWDMQKCWRHWVQQNLHWSTLSRTAVSNMTSYDYSKNSSVSGGDGVKKFIAICGLIFFVFCIFLAFNFYFRYNQKLILLNATQNPVTVQIDDGSSIEVQYGMQKVSVGEGQHVVRVTAPFEAEYSVDVTNSFFGRMFSHAVFMVNLGGEGIIEDMNVIYSENPPPPRVTYRCDEVMVWPDVDFPFEDLPDEISVESNSDQVTKTSLQWVEFQQIAPSSKFMLLMEMDRSIAFKFACNHIKHNPTSHDLMGMVDSHMERGEYKRIRELMESGLDASPVRIDWHRLYQDIPSVINAYPALVKKYDDYLSKSPDSAEFLYLRGRIDKEPEERIKFFEKAIATKPELPAPHIAMIHMNFAKADWQGAVDQIAAAAKCNVDEVELAALKHEAFIALNREDELVSEYESILEEFGGAVGPAIRLAEIQMLKGDRTKAQRTFNSAVDELEKASNGLLAHILEQSRAVGSYITADPAAVSYFEHLGLHPNTALGWAELTNINTLSQSWKPNDEPQIKMIPLVLMLRDSRNQELWWKRAIEQMQHLGEGSQPIADILNKKLSTNQAIAKVKAGLLSPTDAAILLTAMAKKSQNAKERKALVAMAETYNLRRIPPYQLLKKTLDQLKRK